MEPDYTAARQASQYRTLLKRFRQLTQGQRIYLAVYSHTLVHLSIGNWLQPPTLVGASRREEEAFEQIQRLGPGIVMVTERLEQGSGLSLCARLGELTRCPLRMLMVTTPSVGPLQWAEQLGVEAIAMDSGPDGGRPLDALQSVLKGVLYRGPRVQELLSRAKGQRVWLTAQEQQLLQLVARGLTDQQLAEGIGQSRRATQRQLADLRMRLQAGDRWEMVINALQQGLLEISKV